jgi:hypothetical protein
MDRAEQTRLQAGEMMQIAAGYRLLAQHAEERTSGKKDRALSS